jgi:thiol:disulfide interchange protein
MKTLAMMLLVAATLTAAPDVRWETSLPAAQMRAKAEHKLIFLDVYTGWCYWCKKLQQETFPSAEGRAALAGMVPLRIQTEDDKYKPTKDVEFEKRFNIEGFPTMLVLDANGREVAREPGFLPPQQFAAWIAKAAKK